MSFCSLLKGITPKIRMFGFVPINSVVLNHLRFLVFFFNFYSVVHVMPKTTGKRFSPQDQCEALPPVTESTERVAANMTSTPRTRRLLAAIHC